MTFTTIGHPGDLQVIRDEVLRNYDLVYGANNWRLSNTGQLLVRTPLNKADLYFVTGNESKVSSAQRSLGDRLTISKITLDISEDDDTVIKISKHKAKVGYAVVCQPVISDDSSFVIPTLNGYPGIRVKRELEQKGLGHFLNIAKSYQRGYVRAYFEMAVTYYDGKEERTFVSKLHGRLIGETRGNGTQPHCKSKLSLAFVIPGQTKTLAEMTTGEYNQKVTTDRWGLLKEFLDSRKNC